MYVHSREQESRPGFDGVNIIIIKNNERVIVCIVVFAAIAGKCTHI